MKVEKQNNCTICQKNFDNANLIPASKLFGGIQDEIKKDYPQWNSDSYICAQDLKKYQMKYLSGLLNEDTEYALLEDEVLNSILESEVITKNANADDVKLTTGQKVADGIAKFGGSWTFILSFIGVLVLWILINTAILLRGAFDPYPFILLNLVLSCLAAIQAPIIMMSQNRQAYKDRIQSENDYQTNLKAELEIKIVNEKLDTIIDNWQEHQKLQESENQHLIELQQQIDELKNQLNL